MHPESLRRITCLSLRGAAEHHMGLFKKPSKNNLQLNMCRLGIPFLGFRIFPGYIRLLQNSKRRYIRKFKAYENNFLKGIWTISELVSHIEPLNAFISIADCSGFRKSVIERYCRLNS